MKTKKITNTFILTFLLISVLFPSNINAISSNYISNILNEHDISEIADYQFEKEVDIVTTTTTTTYVVKQGDTLDSIAKKNNITIQQLIDLNKITDYELYVGQILNLPNQRPSQISNYSHYDYVIDEYNVKINVNENNTFDIVETITAYFNTYKHGIYRTIPLENKITRLDGTTSKNRVNITKLKVNNKYKVTRKDDMYKITIGQNNHLLTGEQKYKIEYNYNIGKDPLKNIDEFYYNIIGNEWDTVIGNVSFEINMPKNFDATKIGFSSGLVGSNNSSKVTYDVDGTKIIGKVNGILQKNEALTVRLELPEGYFIGAHNTIDKTILMYILIQVFLLIITYLLWIKFGKNDDIVETVEFYPPNDLNSAEIGFLYNGKIDNEDIASLLIYLANKGYIKIIEEEEKEYKIVKIKEYDGNNINEKLFMDGLFKKTRFKKTPVYVGKKLVNNPEEEVIEEKDVVTKYDLYNSFYKTTGKILNNMDSKENRLKIFAKSSLIFHMFTLPITIFTLIYSAIITIEIFDERLGITLVFLGITLYEYFKGEKTKLTAISIIFKLLIFIIIFIIIKYAPNRERVLMYLIGTISSIFIFKLYKTEPKRTEYGKEMLGKIRGFKNFLETAEKDKLESMVIENPTYFYDILPFTYVLGISNKWIEKFESITLQAPTWYDNDSIFDITSFSSFMDSTISSTTVGMSSSSGDSFSGGSGGGSSGSGSGGGGGGSW